MDVQMESEELLQRSDCVEPLRMKRKRPAAKSGGLQGVDAGDFGVGLLMWKDDDGNAGDEDDDSGAPAAKYREVEKMRNFQLEDFSDEVLLEIFKHLDSSELLPLMNCCTRFHDLLLDRRFWINIELSEVSLPLDVIENLLDRTHGQTKVLKVRGPPSIEQEMSEALMHSQKIKHGLRNRCVHLQVLEIYSISLDFESFTILDFPKTLKRLIFNDCVANLPNIKNIFCGMDAHLIHLEEFGIEHSDWCSPEFLMTFSKVPELRWLSLKGCTQLYEFVPYGSMASRFGFKKLEYLDMSFTPITDSDLQCFNAVVTLKEIRLDCPDSMRNTEEKEKLTHCQAYTCRRTFTRTVLLDANDETPSTSAAAANANGFNGVPTCSAQNNEPNSPAVSTNSDSNNSSNNNSINDNNNSSSNNNNNNNNFNNTAPSAEQNGQQQAPIQQQQQCPLHQEAQPMEHQQVPQPIKIKSLLRAQLVDNASPDDVPCSSSSSFQPLYASAQPQSTASASIPPVPSTSANAAAASSSSSSASAASPSLLAAPSNAPPPDGGAQNVPDVEMLPQRNVPSRSRFLPRPEQVILVDLLNRNHSIVVHGPSRAPANGNPINHFDQVLNHPLFWDIINPLAQGGIVRVERAAGNGYDVGNANNNERVMDNSACRRARCFLQSRRYNRQTYSISDRGICCFGRPENPVNPGIIWIRVENRPSENSFHRMSVRNYKMVTDISLLHLVQCSPHLVFLDLSGTNVTKNGVQNFKKFKPDCEVVADHLQMN